MAYSHQESCNRGQSRHHSQRRTYSSSSLNCNSNNQLAGIRMTPAPGIKTQISKTGQWGALPITISRRMVLRVMSSKRRFTRRGPNTFNKRPPTCTCTAQWRIGNIRNNWLILVNKSVLSNMTSNLLQFIINTSQGRVEELWTNTYISDICWSLQVECVKCLFLFIPLSIVVKRDFCYKVWNL